MKIQNQSFVYQWRGVGGNASFASSLEVSGRYEFDLIKNKWNATITDTPFEAEHADSAIAGLMAVAKFLSVDLVEKNGGEK